MSRYRSEEESLRARIQAALEQLRALDLQERSGDFAPSPMSRRLYALGRRVARVWHRLRPADATKLDRLRVVAERLEARLQERSGDGPTATS